LSISTVLDNDVPFVAFFCTPNVQHKILYLYVLKLILVAILPIGLVAAVTDDKNLPKLARKQLQIEHACTASPRVKLIKLADKLYNLRDLQRCSPRGWSAERVQEYFEWAAKVIKGLRRTNIKLEEQLDKLLISRGVHELSM
jgi:hypothetical protein